MGFLDTLLSAVVPAAVGFATGGPAGAIAGGLAGAFGPAVPEPSKIAATTPSSTGLTIPGATATPAAATPGTLSTLLSSIALGGLPQAVLGAQAVLAPTAGAAAGTGCPSGKNRVITTVTTFNAAGQACSQKVLAGRPFLMNKDIVTAKRVFRTIAKASGRLPRKTVKEGKTKQLTDAVMDKALSNVITDNGNGGKC